MKNNTKTIARVSILIALDVTLQLIANFLPSIAGVSITLSLIIIVLSACLLGKKYGALVGFINGVVVIFAPSTLSLFMPVNPLGTIFVCLFKMTSAGFIAGLIYELIKNKKLAVILASLSVPIINTGLFALFCPILFRSLLESLTPEGVSMTYYLLFTFIGFNFIIEFLINSLLAPTIYFVIQILKKRRSF